MGTRGQWAIDFAKALGNDNPSPAIINWISAWTKGEGTKAKFNPLATTLDYGSNTCFNSVCVRNYETRQQGIEASVRTLAGNYPGYSDIVNGIKNNDVNKASNGLIRAPWGTNGALVQNTAALYDVRNEPLLSEVGEVTKVDETIIRGGTKTEHIDPFGVIPTGSVTIPDTTANKAGPVHELNGSNDFDSYTQIGYYIVGFSLIGIALFLIIRNYVPTQQIVRTVASAV